MTVRSYCETHPDVPHPRRALTVIDQAPDLVLRSDPSAVRRLPPNRPGRGVKRGPPIRQEACMSREQTWSYRFDCLAGSESEALEKLTGAVEAVVPRRNWGAGTSISGSAHATYYLHVNRTKAQRLAARLDGFLSSRGTLTLDG